MRSLRVVLALAVLAPLTACGDPPPEAPPDEPAIVGMLETPISLHHADPAPSGALHIEINLDELQLEHHSVYTLDDGNVPAAEVTPNGFRLLAERIAAAPARTAASLTIHGSVPYATTVRTLQTLLNANYRTIHWAVHAPNVSPPAWGWMTMESPRVVAHDAAVTFPGTLRPWSDFTDHWREVYDECNAAERHGDCEGPASLAAEGGELVVSLWARGGLLEIKFEQTNAPDAGPPAAGGGGAAGLDGVRIGSGHSDEEEVPPPMPDALAIYQYRFEEAANPESHLPLSVRPVCGAGSCPMIVNGDADTQTMRLLSLIGAVWADGAAAPAFVFRLPE